MKRLTDYPPERWENMRVRVARDTQRVHDQFEYDGEIKRVSGLKHPMGKLRVWVQPDSTRPYVTPKWVDPGVVRVHE